MFLCGRPAHSFKESVDEALPKLTLLKKLLLSERTRDPLSLCSMIRIYHHELMQRASSTCAPEPLNAEDPLFILYTFGPQASQKALSTHQAGYLLQVSFNSQIHF